MESLCEDEGIGANIRVAAAMIGPGYRGERAQVDDERRRDLAEKIAAAWQDGQPPKYVDDILKGSAPSWIDRRAKLFEIGEYEDKELSVSCEDLQRLAQGFDLPVPVLIEHVENPLHLGYLTQVEAVGAELFGNLALTPEAERLIEEQGAKSLSISVSRSLDKIFEVSIVAHPRVESARLFCANFNAVEKNEWKAEALKLQQQVAAQEVDKSVEELIAKGRIAPVSRGAARRLLFSANKKGIGEEIKAFLESLPVQIQFGELVPQSVEAAAIGEEVDFYRRHFPNIGIEEIMKRKVRK